MCTRFIFPYYREKVNQSLFSPGQTLGVPSGWGSQISKYSAYEGGNVVSPAHLSLISLRDWVDPRFGRNQTHDLPFCNAVPQPSAPSCVSSHYTVVWAMRIVHWVQWLGYWLDRPRIVVQFPRGILWNVQTGFGPIQFLGSFSIGKAAGTWSLPLTSN